MIYNIIFVFLLGISLIELYMYNNNIVVRPQINIGILISIFLVVFAGGRLNTGLDYSGYERYFYMAKDGTLKIVNSIVEPMYVIINRVSLSYRVLLFLMAIGCVVIKYMAFRKLDVKLTAFVMFFYYASFYLYYDMGIMRQGLAMSICLLAIPYAERKDKRFFILVAIAMTFHIEAVFFVVVFFIADKEYSRTTYYILMGVALAFTILANSNVVRSGIFEWVIKKFGGNYLNYKYDRYISYETQNYLFTILKRIILGVVFVEWFKRTRNTADNRKQMVLTYLNGYVISIVLFSVMSLLGFASLAGRITVVLYMLYILIYEIILRSMKHHKLLKVVLLMLFVALSFNTLNDIITSSSGDLYRNYQFFLH